jgi:hypothetical protein
MEVRFLVEEQARLYDSATADTVRQVMFYSAAYEPFAVAWQTGAASGRWAFRFSMDADVTFVNFTLEIMQDTGRPAQHVLIATKGGGAFFYGAPDDAPVNDKTVVGLIPNTRLPTRFANSVATFAPGAPFTLLSDSGAADTVVDQETYKGTEMMSQISAVLGQPMLASDQPVVRGADGVATTVGNIYQAKADGSCAIKYPAPGGGLPQIFPLTPPTP